MPRRPPAAFTGPPGTAPVPAAVLASSVSCRRRASGSAAVLLALALALTACAARAPKSAALPASPPGAKTAAASSGLVGPDEAHFTALRQLTGGGENAEAYWSSDSRELVFQARPVDAGCDRIFRLPVLDPGQSPAALPVSSGAGATTCAFFLPPAALAAPSRPEVIFSSTHLAGAACPPRPDMSQGYVWALHRGYDIFRANADGSGLRRLTDAPGYDAEATVCPIDGSIIFTSVRDGDIDLYRMDAGGGNVRRLTHTPGYDGGAFFDPTCKHIVWRASRPRPGAEEAEYRGLLARDSVRPTKLELWTADADGGNAAQVTYLGAASFAPSFFPDQPRIVFSSNRGYSRGREFDLWAIDTSGANLERITTAPGFDGFPMFSPDGKLLAFASNRATPPGRHDTNLFVATWAERTVRRAEELPADRIMNDVRWLADPAREGRGIGTAGLDAAGTYVEARLQRLGLVAAGDPGSFREEFTVPTAVTVRDETKLIIGGQPVAKDAFTVAAFSGEGATEGALALAGYGIVDKELGIDDYAKRDVRGKIVVVRRFAPDGPAAPAASAHAPAPGDAADSQRRAASDVRRKAFTAREKGARALLVVDLPASPAGDAAAAWKMPDEAAFPPPRLEGAGDAGIPVLFVHRAALAPIVARLEKKQRVAASLKVALTISRVPAYNVVARLGAGAPEARRLPGVVVVGAHYDHLGLGQHHSLAPDSKQPHLGADDNASGTAALLEVARLLAARRAELRRDVVLAAFSGEEEGDLGSTHFTRSPPAPLAMRDVTAMVNLDMVGRLRDNRVSVLGRGSADEWPALLDAACAAAQIDCGGTAGGADGYGPSDQMPFYAAGVPVAHFFTGSHPDYHRPSDTADKINGAGAGQVAAAAAALAQALAAREQPLTLKRTAATAPGAGDMRSFGASLGTIPDYAGPPEGKPGVLLAGVRAGGAADAAGLKRGDILVRLGPHQIRSVEDLMYALGAGKPGQTVPAVVLRDGKELTIDVTFQEGRRTK